MNKVFKLLSIITLITISFPTVAQKSFESWLKKSENAKIEPFIMLQLWSTYSQNQQVYNESSGLYERVDDRLNILLRRARLGFKAEPYDGLHFTVVGAYDLIGRDVNSSLVGGSNNNNLPVFGIWDAYFQWKIKKDKASLFLTGGYFRPQFSRESITSGWSVNSMEKAMSQSYIRGHLVGRSSGRALGVNLGGLLLDAKLNYNIGIFNPVYQTNTNNSTGKDFAPLFVGRMAYSIGDPEADTYKIGYDINYFNQRQGVTVATGGSWQGATDLFDKSYASEVDILLNINALNLDGEWNLMWREGQRDQAEQRMQRFSYRSNTGHIRAGYNLIIAHQFFVEPSFMIMYFQGADSANEQADAAIVGASSGRENTFDAGINWYLDKKNMKVMLHYTWHKGDAGDAGDGAQVNQYFSQSSVGAIQRGNWLGLGVNAIF